MSGEINSSKTFKFRKSNEETDAPVPRPRLNPPVGLRNSIRKGDLSPQESLSPPQLLPKRNTLNLHSDLTPASPRVSSIIGKFEDVKIDYKNSSIRSSLSQKAPLPKVPEKKSPTSGYENQSARYSTMNNLYEDLPVHKRNNRSQIHLRSDSFEERNRSSYVSEFNRNTTINVMRSTGYDEKYMDLYSVLAEKNSIEIIDDESIETYRVALHKLLSAEQEYCCQLQKINILFNEYRTKYSLQTIDMKFGKIRALLKFHEEMLKDIKNCNSMPDLAKLIMDRESEYDTYINDKWLKITKAGKNDDIFLPYNNWTISYLELYNHILKQLVQYKNPAIILASIVINETIDQCKAVEWLSEIQDFLKMSEAGKLILNDKFKIKDNGKDKGIQEVIFLENYILCVTSVNGIKKCFLSFKLSDVIIGKTKSNTLEIKIIGGAKRSTILKSTDSKTIDIWNNRYLLRAFECRKPRKPLK